MYNLRFLPVEICRCRTSAHQFETTVPSRLLDLPRAERCSIAHNIGLSLHNIVSLDSAQQTFSNNLTTHLNRLYMTIVSFLIPPYLPKNLSTSSVYLRIHTLHTYVSKCIVPCTCSRPILNVTLILAILASCKTKLKCMALCQLSVFSS